MAEQQLSAANSGRSIRDHRLPAPSGTHKFSKAPTGTIQISFDHQVRSSKIQSRLSVTSTAGERFGRRSDSIKASRISMSSNAAARIVPCWVAAISLRRSKDTFSYWAILFRL